MTIFILTFILFLFFLIRVYEFTPESTKTVLDAPDFARYLSFLHINNEIILSPDRSSPPEQQVVIEFQCKEEKRQADDVLKYSKAKPMTSLDEELRDQTKKLAKIYGSLPVQNSTS